MRRMDDEESSFITGSMEGTVTPISETQGSGWGDISGGDIREVRIVNNPHWSRDCVGSNGV